MSAPAGLVIGLNYWRILRDEFKDYPESALYMIGAIDGARQESKAEPHLKPEAKPGPEAEHAAVGAHAS